MATDSSLFTDYWQMRMKSAELRLDAALKLISHKPTRGTLAEQVLRKTISCFLPGQWTSHTGFVINESQVQSKQLDIVIYDQLLSAPLYHDDDVVVLTSVVPESGTAREPGPPREQRIIAIEVKSVLNKTSLLEALENVSSFKKFAPKRFAAIIYAFRGFQHPATLKEHLSEQIELLKNAGQFDQQLLPDMICIQEQKVVVVPEVEGAIMLKAYQSEVPVIQSLLTRVITGLGVSNLYPLMPEPKQDNSVFEI